MTSSVSDGTMRRNDGMTRNLLIAACLSLLAGGNMIAQDATPGKLPDAPGVSSQPSSTVRREVVVFHTRVFWSLVAVDAASAVADTQTSWHDEQMFPNGSEENSWLYGQRPSRTRYYATDAVMDGGGAFLSYKLLHSRRKFLHTVGWVLLAGLVGQHTESWIHNIRLHETFLATP